ncbi:uncharacterized protein LOC144115871 isoform X1 [Amblyomma americanum]
MRSPPQSAGLNAASGSPIQEPPETPGPDSNALKMLCYAALIMASKDEIIISDQPAQELQISETTMLEVFGSIGNEASSSMQLADRESEDKIAVCAQPAQEVQSSEMESEQITQVAPPCPGLGGDTGYRYHYRDVATQTPAVTSFDLCHRTGIVSTGSDASSNHIAHKDHPYAQMVTHEVLRRSHSQGLYWVARHPHF